MESHYNSEKVEFSTKDIEDFLFEELIEEGYAPKSEELEVIADIMFDFITLLFIQLSEGEE